MNVEFMSVYNIRRPLNNLSCDGIHVTVTEEGYVIMGPKREREIVYLFTFSVSQLSHISISRKFQLKINATGVGELTPNIVGRCEFPPH